MRRPLQVARGLQRSAHSVLIFLAHSESRSIRPFLLSIIATIALYYQSAVLGAVFPLDYIPWNNSQNISSYAS